LFSVARLPLATTAGEKEAELAIPESLRNWGDGNAFVVVDGQRMAARGSIRLPAGTHRIGLTESYSPGQIVAAQGYRIGGNYHSCQLVVRSATEIRGQLLFEFIAKPGHRYKFESESGGLSASCEDAQWVRVWWISDRDTKEAASEKVDSILMAYAAKR
jgi:hypothetical protein